MLSAQPQPPQTGRRPIVFCDVGIADAPLAPGVYLLFRGFRLIYVGVARPGTTIRECLLRHYHGMQGPCTRVATQFEYEVSDRTEALYHRHVEANRRLTGEAAPLCNRSPWAETVKAGLSRGMDTFPRS